MNLPSASCSNYGTVKDGFFVGVIDNRAETPCKGGPTLLNANHVAEGAKT